MKNLLKRGFTLIELLVVISIIGILTALITTNLQGARIRARDARRKGDLQAISQSLRLYYTDHQGFPAGTNGYIMGCDLSGIAQCTWGSAFKKDVNTIYMGNLPRDPAYTASSPVDYFYHSTNSNNFALLTKLENLSDSDIAQSQARCATIYGGIITGFNKESGKDYIVCAE